MARRTPTNPLEDTVHPNDAGHAIIADAMVQAWTEMTVVDPQLVYA